MRIIGEREKKGESDNLISTWMSLPLPSRTEKGSCRRISLVNCTVQAATDGDLHLERRRQGKFCPDGGRNRREGGSRRAFSTFSRLPARRPKKKKRQEKKHTEATSPAARPPSEKEGSGAGSGGGIWFEHLTGKLKRRPLDSLSLSTSPWRSAEEERERKEGCAFFCACVFFFFVGEWREPRR